MKLINGLAIHSDEDDGIKIQTFVLRYPALYQVLPSRIALFFLAHNCTAMHKLPSADNHMVLSLNN